MTEAENDAWWDKAKYDPFAYGRSLGIPGLLGGPGFVYATSRGPIDAYEKMKAEGLISE